MDLLAGRGACLDQVLLHLGLSVHPHRTAGQLDEVDVVAMVGPLQVDAAVSVTFAVQSFAQPAAPEQVDGGLFEDSCADPGRDVFLRASFQHYRLDAVRGEQVRQEHSGGTRSDDRHLGPHVPAGPSCQSLSGACAGTVAKVTTARMAASVKA